VKHPSAFWRPVELALPWLVLAILSTFTYAKFFIIPYCGFEFNVADGEVTLEYFTTTAGEPLLRGDQLLQIGPVSFTEFQADLRKTIFDGVQPGQTVPIVIWRNGEQHTIQWICPGINKNSALERAISLWWLPYVFWLAGAATMYSLRPKDTRWRLLIAFNFLTALWLAAGNGPSHWHVWESAIILRSAIWLSLPVYWHLHWVFPTPLKRLPPALIWVFYLFGMGMAAAEWFQVLPQSVYYTGFLLAVIGSIMLLIAHAIFQPDQRRDLAVLLIAVGLAVLPVIGMSIAYLFGTPPMIVQGGSFLALPALPGAYFFSIYRQQFGKIKHRIDRLLRYYVAAILLGAIAIVVLTFFANQIYDTESILMIGVSVIFLGTITAFTGFAPFLALPLLAQESSTWPRQPGALKLSANRLIALFLFLGLMGALVGVLIALATPWLNFPGASILVGMVIAYLAGVFAILGFEPFQRWIERRLLGMPLPPTRLLEIYSERITTRLDTSSLVELLQNDVLPSLLVRQSALLRADENGKTVTVYAVQAGDLPSDCNDPRLLTQAGQYRSPEAGSQPFAWVRLALPLKLGEQMVGLWLLGQRDPDDLYDRSEIPVLQALANQTAIALANIRQAERLYLLYQINIERQEAERKRLALELHDDVLNQMAVLSMSTDQNTISTESVQTYQAITGRIRNIIGGLRPPTLNFGLGAAIEELADQVADQGGDDLTVTIDLQDTDCRYESEVELHLFRIAQQACQNALRHAQSSRIQIHGYLQPDEISLCVEDDGVGFEMGAGVDLGWLLSHHHYGLVGMQERGALIGAIVQITSVPKQGTKVRVVWHRDKNA
jgi:signal transduction histidine kinase